MKIGIIGGSGLEDPKLLTHSTLKKVTTPFGEPSSSLASGFLNGVEVVILARHGLKHTIMPTNVNNRANIWALKEERCTHIIASTACGSLQEHIKPGDFVILDQFIDRTTKRHQTFYNDACIEPDVVCHIPLADPFCPQLRDVLKECAKKLHIPAHQHGTVITIEGPRFSTRAESRMFKSWNADVINMSTSPEATLAREAGICYAVVAMSTDYDSWHENKEPVTWEQIVAVFQNNAQKVKELLLSAIQAIEDADCSCKSAYKKSMLGRSTLDSIKSKIRTIPNFPKPGIMFRDITTLLNDKDGFQQVMQIFLHRYRSKSIEVVVGIESRGFILGGAVAHALGCAFVPIRKKGKLPGQTIKAEYELEYGTDTVEIHSDAIKEGQRCLIIDDLIATGGTVCAAYSLVQKIGGNVIESAFVVDLPELGGTAKLKSLHIPYYTMVEFEGH